MASRFISIFILLVWGSANSVLASEYSGANTIVGEGYDVLVPLPANSSGISYNNLASFKVDGKALRIVNLKENNPNGTVADLIVIHSNQIVLAQEIELLGKPADILIIGNTSSGVINCNDCSFKNFGRVTIATASYSGFSVGMSSVGELSASTGSIVVSNLSAPGVNSVELVAGTVSLAGEITTQRLANAHPDGGYEISESGSLVLGSGGVNLYIGDGLVYDYDEIQVLQLPTGELAAVTLNGSIRSASVNITSLAPLNVKSNIDTSSDLLATSFYRDHFNVPSESIIIKSLGDEGLLSISGNITSHKILLRSYEDTILSGVLDADAIVIVSNNRLENTGEILGGFVEVASNKFFNSGRIKGDSVEVIAEKRIHNGYGGEIFADDIVIVSQLGTVINGSKLPFILNGDKWEEGEELIGRGYINGDAGYYQRVDESQGVRADSLRGLIIGKRVAVKGINVKNINPYYEFRTSVEDWSAGIPIDTIKASQVSIRASERLLLEAASVFENASGIIGMMERGGVFQVLARDIYNLRYRVQVALDTYLNQNTGSVTVLYEEGVSSELVIYSPPGTMYSMGDFNAKGKSFFNRLSFFEVYGDAYLDVSYTKTSGIKIQDATFHSYVEIFYTCRYYCGDDGSYFIDTYERTYTFKEETDTLFFVHGNTVAKKLVVRNEESLTGFERPVINFVDEMFDDEYGESQSDFIVRHDVLFRPDEDSLNRPDWGQRVAGSVDVVGNLTQIPFDKGVVDHSGDDIKYYRYDVFGTIVQGEYIDHSDDFIKVEYGRKIIDESHPDNVVVSYEDCTATAGMSWKVRKSPALYAAHIRANVYDWDYRIARESLGLLVSVLEVGFCTRGSSCSTPILTNRNVAREDSWAIAAIYDPNSSDAYTYYWPNYEELNSDDLWDFDNEWRNTPKTVFDYLDATVRCTNKITKSYNFWDSVVKYINELKESLDAMLDSMIDWWEE